MSTDLYRGVRSNGFFPRTASQTTFQASDLVRANVASDGGSCIPDNKVTSSKTRSGRKGGPRLPQRSRYVSDSSMTVRGTLLARSVLADSATRSTSDSDWLKKRDPENIDSGLGLEEPLVSVSYSAYLESLTDASSAEASSSDSEDDIETDCVHTVRKGTEVHIQKQPVKGLLSREPTTQYDMEQMNSYLQEEQEFKERLEAIKRQATERFELSKRLELLLPNSDGDTGFHHAIIHNKPSMLTRLLELLDQYPELHSNIDEQNKLFQTTLHLAVHTQQTEMVCQLLRAGASLHLTDHKGNSPLHIASRSSTKCLDEIFNATANSTILDVSQIRNNQGLTCVHLAVLAGNTEALLRLKRAGVDMNMQDHTSGKTPLHLAVEMGSFQLVQLLVQSCGADFNITTYNGCTPLHTASGRGHIEIVAYLVSVGANPVACTDEGDTPLDLSTSQPVSEFLSRVLYWLN